jgi:transcriptional regulator with XRE-family HTH domain
MIPAVVRSSDFGPWLKMVREGTIDPTTGRRYTLERVAELIGVSMSKVAGWERGQIVSVSPEDTRELARVFKRPVREFVEAMGYDIEEEPITADERRLLAAYRRLRGSPILQDGAIRVVEALPPGNPPPTRRSRSLRDA